MTNDSHPPVTVSATGLMTPSDSISNAELVSSFNQYVVRHNERNAEAIARGELQPLEPSNEAFIEKASGIKSRYVVDKVGILDPEIMCPRLPERSDQDLSLLAEMACTAAREALERAECSAGEVDAVIVACSNLERAYPAVAIEIQQELGIGNGAGFGFDMNVACSSATFGVQAGVGLITAGAARRVLVCNPEVCSGHLNFRDRDAHFIFGDVATAVLLERTEDVSPGSLQWQVLGAKCLTHFSNNIRNNFGFLNRTHPESRDYADKLFVQEGRKVFKEVSPMVAQLILEHLGELGIKPEQLKRMWLHQANLNMNQLISRRVLGRDATADEAPVILDEYANTSSAGSVIAMHKYGADFVPGDLGLLCSFGAGYSIGSVVIRAT